MINNKIAIKVMIISLYVASGFVLNDVVHAKHSDIATTSKSTAISESCDYDEIWSDEEEECEPVFYCQKDSDCGPYAECIGKHEGKKACLPI